MMPPDPSISIALSNKRRTRSYRNQSSAGYLILHIAAAWVISLYLFLSPETLSMIGWHYLGEGLEVEKIHPATYLLVLLFVVIMTVDAQFRSNALRQLSEFSLWFFTLSCFAAALYATVDKGVSIAPFVDTFLSAILVTIITVGMRRTPLIHLRVLLDIGIAANVLLLIIGYLTQRESVLGIPTGEFSDDLGTRWAGMLGLPLSAAQILCAYPLIVLMTTPNHITKGSIVRLCLAVSTIFVSLLTGGRTSIIVMAGLLLIYALYSTVRQIVRGSVSKIGLSLFIICVVLVGLVTPIMLQLGFFDLVISRLQFDNGSALAREFAFQILGGVSSSDLVFGVSATTAAAQQQEYGLIAIEIAWINFILICGLVFTIPLFVGFCLFLFRYLPKCCTTTIQLFSAYTLISTFSYNSIWSKTTVLAITLAIGVSNLRRDLPLSRAAVMISNGTRRRPRRLSAEAGHDEV
jgi:hypothetical protein